MHHRITSGRILIIVATVCGLATVATLADEQPNAETSTKAGVASVDITPEFPIRLTGYGNRSEEATEVEQPLHAKAMAIEAGDAPLSVLITADVLGIPASVTEEVAARLNENAGIERAQLAICATHTHTGPTLRGVAPALFGGPLPEDQQDRVDRYTDQLADKLEQVAMEAIEDRRPATLAWGQGTVDFAVNRRRIVDGKWAGWGAFPDAPADHDLPVLAVKTPGGEVRGLLVNYACHCTTLVGGHNFIHGDWAGEAALRLEAEHEGAVAMIAIGCGADANPQPRGAIEHVDQHGQAIADEVARVLADDLTPIRHGPQGDVENVALPFEPITREELVERTDDPLFGYSASMLLEDLERGEPVPTELDYPIQTWTFGDTLAMVFLPGEVVADYAIRLKGELDGSRLWVNAYANESPSYIASARVIGEGGYEVDASMAYYHKPNRFRPEIEDTIVSATRAMLAESYARQWDDAEPAELLGDNQPRLITPDDDGALNMLAEAGTPYGPRIEYMSEAEIRAFGWWTDQDYVAWDVEVERPGTYAVHMEWSVADDSAQRPYILEAGGDQLRGFVESTGTWGNFKTAEIGTITLESGQQTIAMKPAGAFDPGGLMDLRALRLTPVD